jgi:hypothetical protein
MKLVFLICSESKVGDLFFPEFLFSCQVSSWLSGHAIKEIYDKTATLFQSYS